MAAKTYSESRTYVMGDIEDYPMVEDSFIYEGSAVGEDGNGHSRALVAGDVFQGFCTVEKDNAGGSAGDEHVRVKTQGKIELPITGLTITANDRVAVYASDDDTFTLSAAGNSLIGYVSRYKEDGVGIIQFDAALVRAALQA